MSNASAPQAIAARVPVLELRALQVRFPMTRRWPWQRQSWVRAVEHVDLTLHEGEVLGIVGESGCGKSTVARVIAGLLEPSEGEVLLGGQRASARVRTRGAPAGRVQLVFQDPFSSLNPRHRIGRVLAEPLIVHRLCAAGLVEQRVRSALDEVGLPAEVGRRYPHELSGGQRQRVAIARALITQPDVVVADEAVSALDVSVRAQILNLLKALQRSRNLSMLFISHDLGVVRYLCERAVVMYRGRIVESGSTRQLLDQPAHAYTRELRAAALAPDPTRRAADVDA